MKVVKETAVGTLTPAYVSKKGASLYAAQSVRVLDEARQRGDLPFYKRGKTVLFCVADLDKWLERFRVDATTVQT